MHSADDDRPEAEIGEGLDARLAETERESIDTKAHRSRRPDRTWRRRQRVVDGMHRRRKRRMNW
jgi:hypothetical protein